MKIGRLSVVAVLEQELRRANPSGGAEGSEERLTGVLRRRRGGQTDAAARAGPGKVTVAPGVDESVTSIFLVCGGLRWCNSGEAVNNREGEGVSEDQGGEGGLLVC